jgi:hypothetical protein
MGILMGRGLTPDDARAHLSHQADDTHLRVFQVAAGLLALSE